MRKTSEKKLAEHNLGERLSYLRGHRKLTQSELSKKAGVSQSTIAQIEAGKKDPSVQTLKKLAEALEIHIAIFFASDDVHIFDMGRLAANYRKVEDLNDTLYRAIGEVVRFAKKIGFC